MILDFLRVVYNTLICMIYFITGVLVFFVLILKKEKEKKSFAYFAVLET